jgi:hypothetical protein
MVASSSSFRLVKAAYPSCFLTLISSKANTLTKSVS